MIIELRATYETYWWEDDDEEPCAESGYTDVHNPWGGFKSSDEQPYHCSPIEAAVIVADFPGAVWDYEPECDPSQDFRTGKYTRVTLHVQEPHDGFVFELANLVKQHPALRW